MRSQTLPSDLSPPPPGPRGPWLNPLRSAPFHSHDLPALARPKPRRPRLHSAPAIESPRSSPARSSRCVAGNSFHRVAANNLAKLATSRPARHHLAKPGPKSSPCKRPRFRIRIPSGDTRIYCHRHALRPEAGYIGANLARRGRGRDPRDRPGDRRPRSRPLLRPLGRGDGGVGSGGVEGMKRERKRPRLTG